MTVATEDCILEGAVVALGVAIPLDWPVHAANEVVVRVSNGTFAVLNVDYTVTLEPPDYDGASIIPLAGLVFKADGDPIDVIRDTPAIQPLAIPVNSRLPEKEIEKQFDRGAMRDAEMLLKLNDLFTRAITVPDGETGFSVADLATRLGKFPIFTSDGFGYVDAVPSVSTPGPETVGAAELKPGAVTYVKLDPGTVRIPLIADATIYINDSTGNDANNGTVGFPLKTLQGAWNWAVKRDLRGFAITARIAAGTYAAGVQALFPLVGGGKLTYVNDGIVLVTSGVACFSAKYGAQIDVRPNGTHVFEGRATAVGFITEAQWGGGIKVGAGFTYGQGHVGAIHNYATRAGSNLEIESGCFIKGGGDNFCQASHGGNIRLAGGTLTFQANVTFTGAFLYALSGADITATGGLLVDYATFTVTAIRFIVHAAVIQWIFAYGGRDGPPGNSPGYEIEGGRFLEGAAPYGSAPVSAFNNVDCAQGSFVATMSALSATVVPVNVPFMPSRIEFFVSSIGLADAEGSGCWIRGSNTNYGRAKRPTTKDMFPTAVSSIYFFATDTAGFVGTVTAWSTYQFSVTLSKFGAPTGDAVVYWKAYR